MFFFLQLESKKDAFSKELQQYCLSQPVVVIRGLAAALKLGLQLTISLKYAFVFLQCGRSAKPELFSYIFYRFRAFLNKVTS